MKKITILISYFLFLISNIAFAASYPASCPTEAKAIVDAVGGCSAIDKNKFSSVYQKCCAIKPIPPATSAPVVTPPAVTPIKTPQSPAPAQSAPKPAPKPVPKKSLPQLKYSLPFFNLPYFSTSTSVSEPVVPSKPENESPTILKEKPQSVFNRILRFFRFR